MTSNLESLELGILSSALSKTFQDAITITRKLSVQYLWINSLCIIQDDPQDWERESAQMASIYENAYLVISAAHASDGSKGCFVEQSAPPVASMPFYNHVTEHGIDVPIYLRHGEISHRGQDPSFFISQAPGERLPLLLRAWVLQERLLATRTVHFTGQEMVWECRQSTACECMHLDRVEDLSPSRLPIKKHWRNPIKDRNSSRFALWAKIRNLYMHLHITYASDRLPALSGRAKQMQGAKSNTYLAGLWLDNILKDMLWEVVQAECKGERETK